MPALNMALRQEVADRINAGQGDEQIRRETKFTYVKAVREILALGLPLSTRIRHDGSVNTEPRAPRKTIEYQRAQRKEWRAKLKAAGVTRLRDIRPATAVIEPDGTLNTITTEPLPIESDKPKKAIDLSKLIQSEARDFQNAWKVKLKQGEWSVSDKQAVIGELSALRTLTTRMINKVKEQSK